MHKYVPPPIAVGQSTDVGRRRHENQDSMGYAQLDRFAYKGAHLVICCDGMGGASGGQQASSTAVNNILEYFQEGHPSPEPDLAIREAVEKAADSVQQKAQADPRLEGMGTTCVVVILHNGYLFAGHIGDSRLYLWRNGKMIRLSRDHSRVQFMVEAGIITEEEAKKHPHQNFLARVLGSNQQPRVELLAPPRKMQLGDRLLLCSDGLYNEVEEDTMAEVIAQLEPQAATEKLVELANQNGGNDNITVQIVSYGDIQPKVLEEAWFQFERPSQGVLFYVACCVLFFLLGFFSGRTGQPPQKPTTKASFHGHGSGKSRAHIHHNHAGHDHKGHSHNHAGAKHKGHNHAGHRHNHAGHIPKAKRRVARRAASHVVAPQPRLIQRAVVAPKVNQPAPLHAPVVRSMKPVPARPSQPVRPTAPSKVVAPAPTRTIPSPNPQSKPSSQPAQR